MSEFHDSENEIRAESLEIIESTLNEQDFMIDDSTLDIHYAPVDAKLSAKVSKRVTKDNTVNLWLGRGKFLDIFRQENVNSAGDALLTTTMIKFHSNGADKETALATQLLVSENDEFFVALAVGGGIYERQETAKNTQQQNGFITDIMAKVWMWQSFDSPRFRWQFGDTQKAIKATSHYNWLLLNARDNKKNSQNADFKPLPVDNYVELFRSRSERVRLQDNKARHDFNVFAMPQKDAPLLSK